MMKKQPSATQQALIDNGHAARTLTIRYESTGSWGAPTRRETVKTTLPDLGDGHPTFQVSGDTYHVVDGNLYIQQHANLSAEHWNRPAGELNAHFHLSDGADKTEAVNEAYDREYSNAVVVNDCIARHVAATLYAHLTGDEITVVDDLDTTGRFDGGEWTRFVDPRIGVWLVPLIHAAKLRGALRENVRSHGGDGSEKIHDATKAIPFTDEAVAAALEKNAEGAQWGVENGVYIPTTAEMDAARELHESLRNVSGGYNTKHGISVARRISEALAAYEEARKGATVL